MPYVYDVHTHTHNAIKLCVCFCRQFVSEINVTGLAVDDALRKFQSQFRLPVRHAVHVSFDQ